MTLLLIKDGIGHGAELPKRIGHWVLDRAWETKNATKGRYSSECATQSEYYQRRAEARPELRRLKDYGWYVD